MIIKVTETEKLKNDQSYQTFLNENTGEGNLKVRATSASEALPVVGVSVVVSKNIGENTIVFFEGTTDESGMINDIKLPTPTKNSNDLEAPKFATYELKATYKLDNFDKTYNISLCCGVSVVQYINITPAVDAEMRINYGS